MGAPTCSRSLPLLPSRVSSPAWLSGDRCRAERQHAAPERAVQKISAWAAILIVPTIITSVYGMTFDPMPELHWLLGYSFALSLVVVIPVPLYFGFERSGWL